MKSRSIERLVAAPAHRMTASFSTRSLRETAGFAMNPFISIDEFWMSQPTFPPHPHAGFSAVTYMLEDSEGAFTNRDSLGDHSRIEPGALHWTQAANGMLHEEIPEFPGELCHGLQLFVNLRSDHKRATPKAFHVGAKNVAEARFGAGARVRVLAGTFAGEAATLKELLTQVLLLDVHLNEGAEVEISMTATQTLFAFVLNGLGKVGDTNLAAHTGVGFAPDGDRILLQAGTGGLHVIVGGGVPIAEPIVFGGPFVMNSRAEVVDAQERFRRGEMGRLG
jgi:redox-sensitive bicupin YhaK (pirin superfamily)